MHSVKTHTLCSDLCKFAHHARFGVLCASVRTHAFCSVVCTSSKSIRFVLVCGLFENIHILLPCVHGVTTRTFCGGLNFVPAEANGTSDSSLEPARSDRFPDGLSFLFEDHSSARSVARSTPFSDSPFAVGTCSVSRYAPRGTLCSGQRTVPVMVSRSNGTA